LLVFSKGYLAQFNGLIAPVSFVKVPINDGGLSLDLKRALAAFATA